MRADAGRLGELRCARELCDETDREGNGRLGESQIAQLYRKARGEKLGKSDLRAAMDEMQGIDLGGAVVNKGHQQDTN